MTASQSGNSNFTRAPSVARSFTVRCFPAQLPFAVITANGDSVYAQLNLTQTAAQSGGGCIGTFTVTLPSVKNAPTIASGTLSAAITGTATIGTLTGSLLVGTAQVPFTVGLTLDISTYKGSMTDVFHVGKRTITLKVTFKRDSNGNYVITGVTRS